MIPGNINTALISGAEGGGYQIQRSLRFNSSDSGFCGRNFTSAGNQKKWSWSAWVKKCNISSQQSIWSAGSTGTNRSNVLFQGSGEIRFFNYAGSVNVDLVTTAVFRDPSAWYHLLIAVDTTQATSTERVKLYVNGTQITTFSSATYPSQNLDLVINSAITHGIGRGEQSGGEYFDGYLADVIFADGQQLTPSTLVEVSATTGRLEPKQYAGSFGANGFWLKFSDNSAATATTLGKDYSGNNNNWSPSNLSVTAGAGNDSLVDTPSSGSQVDTGLGGQVTGNYCTWNPLDAHSSLTITNGNLDLSNTAGTTRNVRGTIGFPSSGKWYYEVTPGGSVQGAIGIGSSAVPFNAQNAASSVTYFEDGSKGVDASRTAYGSSYASGDVIGIAFNADTNQVTFYKNGVSQGALSTTAGVQYFPFIVTFNATYSANFGQRAFAYPVSGFKCLADVSLPAPVVAKPNTVMDVKLYTGNGGTNSITGLGFSPDLVWLKSRSQNSSHCLLDTVRGRAGTLNSNDTAAEYTASPSDKDLVSFDSTGFTLGQNYNNVTNTASSTYAAWCWDAGSSTVTNTQGSITSSCRTNQSSGFSIVSWSTNGSSNQSIGHGLNVAPQLLLVKTRGTSCNWNVWFNGFTSDEYLFLNSTDAKAASGGNLWYQTPSSSVFSVGFTGSCANPAGSGNQMITYAFAPVAGYSAMGSYVGNGSSDGPMITTMFRPRWVMLKQSSGSGTGWQIHDTSRNTYNVMNNRLQPNNSDAESTYTTSDFLSNGFKLRDADPSWNSSGATYIYFAVAESPFAYSRAR